MDTAPNSAAPASAVPLLVVMGVTGSGKTTVGIALAQRLQVPFADADDFHSEANVAKMSAGVPLDDDDRLPWLRSVGSWLAGKAGTGGVMSCSALKRSYRDLLRDSAPEVVLSISTATPRSYAAGSPAGQGTSCRFPWSTRR
ncbi:gluconokinase [Streptosporangium lutulentum]